MNSFELRVILPLDNKRVNMYFYTKKDMATKLTVRLTTTHVDRHGERMALESLETMKEQTNAKIIPMGVEHDPRIAPKGRVLSAELIELEDGEYALDGVAEIFNEDYSNIEDVGDREIPVREYEDSKFKIIADRNYRSEESRLALNELAQVLQTDDEYEEEIKKSLDPISILTIAAGFALGNIFAGFFKKMGADGYDALKNKLINIFGKDNEGQERLFTFDSTIVEGDKAVNVEVILSDPSDDDIQNFFDNGIKELDDVLPQHFNSDHGYKRIVFGYKNGELKINFAVLKNGVPVYPNRTI